MRPVAHQPITFVQDNTIPVPLPPSLGYGLLYNWYAATDERGIAPDGFRVPSKADYDNLVTELGSNSGFKLKSPRDVLDGDPYWSDNAEFNTNDFDFNLFGPGYRRSDTGLYQEFREAVILNTTTEAEFNPNSAYFPRSDAGSALNTAQTSAKNQGGSIRCVSTEAPSATLVQDSDGNNYTWVQIGSQYWLAQSLRTTKYNNGDDIPTGLDDAAWAATTDGAWAYPNGDATLPI